MGTTDVPPPGIPGHVVPISSMFPLIGGICWTVCYCLYARESFRSKSYGMPMFALAINIAWEAVYAFNVTDIALDKTIFVSWLLIDGFMWYGTSRYARNEWAHSPHFVGNFTKILLVMTVVGVIGQWSFAQWWIDNNIGKKEGKYYRGVVGPDVTELIYWSASFNQVYLSITSLCQLMIRQHSGGVSWGIWATRTLGTLIELHSAYLWEWYFWPDAHTYVVSPLAIFLTVLVGVCDISFAFVLRYVEKTEIVLEDGRKIPGPQTRGHLESSTSEHSSAVSLKGDVQGLPSAALQK